MKNAPSGVVHFVKLVDAADAVISQNQSASATIHNSSFPAGANAKLGNQVTYVCSTSCRLSGSLVT